MTPRLLFKPFGESRTGRRLPFFSEAAYQQVLTKSIHGLNYVTSLSEIEIHLGMFALAGLTTIEPLPAKVDIW